MDKQLEQIRQERAKTYKAQQDNKEPQLTREASLNEPAPPLKRLGSTKEKEDTKKIKSEILIDLVCRNICLSSNVTNGDYLDWWRERGEGEPSARRAAGVAAAHSSRRGPPGAGRCWR